MEKRPFAELGLSPEVLKAVERLGFEEASPIQTLAIPLLMAGKDVVGQSATGSGKTAAYAIPVIEKTDPKVRAVQGLILCPTRELAVQVAEEVTKLSLFKRGIHGVPIYGGQSYERQLRALHAGAQIVIGTPGRIMDHLDRGTLKLDQVRLVVLDETDRMLDMGFRDDIKHILEKVPREGRQLLFFSATMPREIHDLIRAYTREPEWVKIEAKEQNAPAVDQCYYEVDRRSKLEVLSRLIDFHDFKLGIVFCSTKVMVDELADHLLARGYAADRLHGDMNQGAREKTLGRFRSKKVEFLIATDVAGRGLDVDDIEVVFNYDLPNDAEDYVHRIGRTARAGKSGRAITFVSGREIYRLQGIIRATRMKIRRERVPSLDQVEEKKTNEFFEELKETLEKGEFEKRNEQIDRLLEQGFESTDIASALIHLHLGGDLRRDFAGPDPAEEEKRREARGHDENRGAGPRFQGGFAGRGEPPGRFGGERPRFNDRFARGPGGPPPPDMRDDRRPGPPQPQYDRQEWRERERRREPGMKRLYFNIGNLSQVTPGNIVGAIAGLTGLPGSVVGAIDIFEKHTFVDVHEDHVEDVLTKLNGIRMKGRYLDVAVVPEDA